MPGFAPVYTPAWEIDTAVIIPFVKVKAIAALEPVPPVTDAGELGFTVYTPSSVKETANICWLASTRVRLKLLPPPEVELWVRTGFSACPDVLTPVILNCVIAPPDWAATVIIEPSDKVIVSETAYPDPAVNLPEKFVWFWLLIVEIELTVTVPAVVEVPPDIVKTSLTLYPDPAADIVADAIIFLIVLTVTVAAVDEVPPTKVNTSETAYPVPATVIRAAFIIFLIVPTVPVAVVVDVPPATVNTSETAYPDPPALTAIADTLFLTVLTPIYAAVSAVPPATARLSLTA